MRIMDRNPQKNNARDKTWSPVISPWFLFFCFLITISMIGWIMYSWTTHFDYADGIIEIEYVTPQKKRDFNAMHPAQVTVGFNIKNFREFDILHNQFECNALMWFDFDPALITADSVADISCIRGEILSKSEPISYVHDGRLRLVYDDMRIKFTNDMNYKYFPGDDHRISLCFINKSTSISELLYQARNADFTVQEDMESKGWHNFDQRVHTGYLTTQYGAEIDRRPVALFTIDYGQGRHVRNSLTLILPMILLFFSALFVFLFNRKIELDLRIAAPMSALVGLVTFRFVLESMCPSVGYFMYVDYLFALFLVLMFFVAIIGSFPLSLSRRTIEIIIIFLNALVVGAFWYLF